MKAVAEESAVVKQVALNQNQLTYLKRIEESTFRGFKKLLDPATDLPVDIASISQGDVSVLPGNAYYSKTSPTNIGLGFIYLILARDRGYLPEEDALRHTEGSARRRRTGRPTALRREGVRGVR